MSPLPPHFVSINCVGDSFFENADAPCSKQKFLLCTEVNNYSPLIIGEKSVSKLGKSSCRL